jgi:stage III sporulation protein SpoIIIAA
VVREATRILAVEHNVLVVDTSNEIAGDGMIRKYSDNMSARLCMSLSVRRGV